MSVKPRVQQNFSISQELDEKFRTAVFNKKGFKKGVLSKSFEEAIENWIKEEGKK